MFEAAAAQAHEVWGYNRENYEYDRKQRQKQEFQTAEMRLAQAKLWREDVRDLAELTMNKMERYTFVNVVQMGCAVSLFCAGRLEPGAPDWLLVSYQLSLTGAFAYLFMALWFAMFASVTAQASTTRLLLQLVRLPIPSWQQLEAMRTYLASFESLKAHHALRFPFVDMVYKHWRRSKGGPSASGSKGTVRASTPPARGKRVAVEGSAATHGLPSASIISDTTTQARLSGGPRGGDDGGDAPDPWNLEKSGADIYELQKRPVAERRHIQLVRRAAGHWQATEGFARVAMTMGTNQLLFALTYYNIGYLLIEDGEVWSVWLVTCMLIWGALATLQLDLSLTLREWRAVMVLNIAGPLFTCVGSWGWSRYTRTGRDLQLLALPFGNFAHAAWLLYSLSLADAQEQPNGTVLPMKWRGVLLLDVFGWLVSKPSLEGGKTHAGYAPMQNLQSKVPSTRDLLQQAKEAEASSYGEDDESSDSDEGIAYSEQVERMHQLVEKLRIDIAVWSADGVQAVLTDDEKARVAKVERELDELEHPWVSGHFEKLRPTPQSALPAGWLRLQVAEPPQMEEKGLWKRKSKKDAADEVIFHTRTGEVRRQSVHSRHRNDPERPPLSISWTESDLKELQRLLLWYMEHDNEDAPQMSHEIGHRASADMTTWVGDNAGARPQDIQSGAATNLKGSQSLLYDELMTHRDGKLPATHMSSAGILHGIGPTGTQPVADVNTFATFGFSAEAAAAAEDRAEELKSKDKLESSASSSDLTDFAPRYPGVARRGIAKAEGQDSGGDVPWILFKRITLALSMCWWISTGYSISRLSGYPAFEVEPLAYREVQRLERDGRLSPEEAAKNYSRIAGKIHQEQKLRHEQFLQLSPGSTSMAAFEPTSLSCDSTGRNILLADDFSMLRLQTGDATVRDSNSMRGTNDVTASIPGDCQVAGRLARDISISCQSQDQCLAVALTTEGSTRLTTCELGTSHLSKSRSVWTVSPGWLDKDEQVQSFTILPEPECTVPGDLIRCSPVFVSTSQGRLVRLRPHSLRSAELVPLWSTPRWVKLRLEEQKRTTSLHGLADGSIAWLVPSRHKIYILDGVRGNVRHSYSVPQDVSWQAICGASADKLLGLGQVQGGHRSLWRLSAM